MIKVSARILRKSGMTYAEIQNILNISPPKSTPAYWCKGVVFSTSAKERLANSHNLQLIRLRQKAHQVLKEKRKLYLQTLADQNKTTPTLLSDDKVANSPLCCFI